MNKLFKDLIVFEMANNHQGDLQHGLNIIHKAGEVAKANRIKAAVKLQYRDLDSFIHPNYVNRNDVKHIPRFLSTKLLADEFGILVKAIKSAGMHAICTPFDEVSVDLCIEHEIDVIKIASCSSMDWPLLEVIVETNKPIIISTGGKSISDMDKIYNFMKHKGACFAMLHCVGMYPVTEDYVQLNCIEHMRNRYPDIPIGYSGHESPQNYDIVKMAIAKGANILERHIGMSTDTITLNSYSTDVSQLSEWIEAIVSAKKICGKYSNKVISESEIKSLNELARGCYVRSAVQKNKEITRNDIYFAMPCVEGQMTSGQFIEGIIASKDYSKDEALFEKREQTRVSNIRSIIHEVKGMMNESKVIVGNKFELELSHHYGMDNFRNIGVTMINIVNREYCKKLLIVLPRQKHPEHYHKLKEETFQVLYGILNLEINGKAILLYPGEIFTVERLMNHSFSSETGCIFEEISSRHIKKDSYYCDENINKMDIIERKTILKDW